MSNIILKTTSLNECDALFRIFNHDDVVRYTNFKRFEEIDSLKLFLEKFLSIHLGEPLQFGTYSIYLNSALIGLCGLQQINVEEGISELWYLLHKDYWGQGLAKQAVELLLQKSTSTNLLKCIYAEALSINVASWSILEQFGFIQTAELINGFTKGNIQEDLRQYLLHIK